MKIAKLLFPALMACLCVISGYGAEKKSVSNQKSGPMKEKVTFIELGSVGCTPCKLMQPVMRTVESNFNKQVKVVFYDVWTEEGKPYGQAYKIRVIPTQVFLDKNGVEYFRHEGYFPYEELEKILKQKGVK